MTRVCGVLRASTPKLCLETRRKIEVFLFFQAPVLLLLLAPCGSGYLGSGNFVGIYSRRFLAHKGVS